MNDHTKLLRQLGLLPRPKAKVRDHQGKTETVDYQTADREPAGQDKGYRLRRLGPEESDLCRSALAVVCESIERNNPEADELTVRTLAGLFLVESLYRLSRPNQHDRTSGHLLAQDLFRAADEALVAYREAAKSGGALFSFGVSAPSKMVH